MLIQHGNIASLRNTSWFALELQSDLSGAMNSRAEAIREELILAIARWIAKRRNAVELFIPVSKRGLGGIDLLTPCVWIRGSVSGIESSVSLRRAAIGFQRSIDGTPVLIEDSFVQGMIKQCIRISQSWCKGIRVGSCVRVLYGQYRMFCGKVLIIRDGLATVELKLRVRSIRLIIPVTALQRLNGPQEYFCS